MAKKSRKVFATTATAALVASAVAPIASSAAGFSDVTKPEYKTAIDALAEAGILNGYENGTFKPENKVTRGEVAKVITLIRHLEEGTKTPFKDVKDGYWSTQYINSLYAAKLVNGYEDGTFKPEGNVTRAEFAKLVVDAYGLTLTNAATPFTDVKAGNWATPYIQTAYANGLIKGVTASKFDPSAPIKRGDLAILLHRADSKFGDVIGNNFPGVELVKATNNTTVEVTFKNEVDAKNVKAANFSIEGLTVSNAAVKQTDSKTVVLTTSAQEGGKQYTVKSGAATLGKFIGASAVVPSDITVNTKSLQGVIGEEVTLSAQVKVKEGESAAGIPVTFNVQNDSKDNKTIEVEALTNDKGVAEYSYTRYYNGVDNAVAYATKKSTLKDNAKVYWASAKQLSVSELTTGNDLANNTKKSYKVTGKANTTYYVAIKENIGVTPDKITNVMVQSQKDNKFVTPYELTTGSDVYATVTTNASGEGSFTVYGSNLSATPVVYLPSSVNSAADYSYSPLALQAEAPTVKFSQMDKLAIKVAAEGVANSAEYVDTPKAYNGNSVGGRTYTVTVTDKDGKVAPEGTKAYVAFEAGNIEGDVYFSTGTADFVKVSAGNVKEVTVGKEGKATFRVAGKGATTFVKPTVFLNTAGSTTDVKLDKTDVQVVGEVTYFKTAEVKSAVLTVKDKFGRTVTSLSSGEEAFFTYQSVDQNGFAYRPASTTTGATTQTVWVPVDADKDGVVDYYVQETRTVGGTTVTEYTLAFDVTSLFGNATVKDAAGNLLTPTDQNLGTTKTYLVKSDAEGKAIVRVTSSAADTVTVNVTGSSNILPTSSASVSFTNSASVPSLYTGVVESYDTKNQTLKFKDKNPISYVGDKVAYRNLNNQPIASADNFIAELAKATGTVQVTYEVKDGVTTFYIYSIATSGDKPVDAVDAQKAVDAEAAKITSSPAITNGKLDLPLVASGYSVAIKSTSDEKVIAKDRTVTPQDAATTVDVVFTVTSADNKFSADSAVVKVTVPAKEVAKSTDATLKNVAGKYTVGTATDGKADLTIEKDATVAITDLAVTATDKAKVVVKDASGTAVTTGNLADNYTVEVTAEDGTTKITYTVKTSA